MPTPKSDSKPASKPAAKKYVVANGAGFPVLAAKDGSRINLAPGSTTIDAETWEQVRDNPVLKQLIAKGQIQAHQIAG